ncbi:MAG: RNA polymerase sigma factor [Gemmatimonadales bacterium]|nr:RNA polymerase sigma factor [Gemmatimonadales bacterium]
MPTTYTGTETLRTTDASTADADAIDAALAASGDAHAFERLYRRHVNRVHNLVRRMLGEDAEDVTQEVLVRAWQKLGTFRGEAAFGTWLHRLAVNVILNRRTSRGRWRRLFVEEPEGGLDRPGRPASPSHGLDFETAMARLSPGARQVFVLHDVEGYRHEEIAGMLGISVGTSKSQLHYARMALRKTLG